MEGWGFKGDIMGGFARTNKLKSGWWLTYPSEKSWSFSNSWDDDIPIYDGKS
jgi:hypothetical protein